jgi:putative transposase
MKAEREASHVMDAPMMAVWRREKADALHHHSDQRSQYTSEQFQRLLTVNGITRSMSRSVNAWEDSAMESFFSSLETEQTAYEVYRTRDKPMPMSSITWNASTPPQEAFKTGLTQPHGVRDPRYANLT